VFDTLLESGQAKVGDKKWYLAPISIIIHGIVIGIIILIPILFPQMITEKINVKLFAPPPPPPPPPPPAAAAPKPIAPKPDISKIVAPTETLTAPDVRGTSKGEGGEFGVIGGVIGGSTGGSGSDFLKEVAKSVSAESVLPPPVMVTANMTPPALISQVNPTYPELARKAGVEGTVLLRLIIGAEGKVQEAKVLTVIPPKAKGVGFEDEAVRAVMQWKFSPALSGRKPVRVYYNVPVKFILQ